MTKIKKIDVKELNETVSELNVRPSQEIFDALSKDILKIEKSLKLIENIKIDNVRPMHRVHEEMTTYLREDIIVEDEILTVKEIQSNTKNNYGNYILIPKVIK